MPSVSHHGHMTNSHNGWTPGAIIATASNFSLAGAAIARVGDSITTHAHGGSSPPHAGATIATGAASFSVGGKAVARVDDPTSCGGKIALGAGNFSIGG